MANRICDNCMSPAPIGAPRCPKCGIQFENTNPGGALPNGWVLGDRYTIGRYQDIDGEGVTYAAIDAHTLQRVTIKEFMPVTLCATRTETGAIQAKPGCEVLFKTTRMDFSELYGILLRMGLVEGLIQVLDVLEGNNTAYAVLEKIEGPTLSEYLAKRQGPIDPARAIALLRPVMGGVDSMHAANLIHRGISPDNIILESGGTARLGGFATLALRQQGSELKPKLYPGYSAPEQYAASEFEGRYTDVYALGAVLYRLVTGEVPYPANERKMQDTMRPARSWNKDVPSFLSSGIARAMRVVPAERIQTVPDLRLALSGEAGRGSNTGTFLGLTRQQLIIGIAAIAAVVVLLLVVLLVRVFTSGNKGQTSSSATTSIASSSTVEEGLMDFTGKVYADVVKNPNYLEEYVFAAPVEEYNADVEEGRIVSQDPPPNTPYDGKTPIKFVVSKGVQPVAMPDFVSQPTTQAAAERTLQGLGFTTGVTVTPRTNNGEVEPGTVVETNPKAGTEVRPGKDPIVLYVAGEVNKVVMPNVVGLTQAAAEAEMNRLGIKFSVDKVPNDGTKNAGIVAETVPGPGSEVATGSTNVIIKVYDKYYMPDLSGYIGQKPEDGLNKFLDDRHIGRKQETGSAAPSDAQVGTIERIDYTVNAEVVPGTTTAVIYVYGPVATP